MANDVESLPKYMNPVEFANYTGIPLRAVRKLMADGHLKGFKHGRTHHILVESYKDFARSFNSDECVTVHTSTEEQRLKLKMKQFSIGRARDGLVER